MHRGCILGRQGCPVRVFFHFMSLTQKLVLTFLLVTLIPIAVIIWVSRQTLLEQAQQQIGTRLEDSVVQVGKSMDEFMFNCCP